MNDMTSVITPKSDQLSADDLISGPRTITITGVSIVPGEQPVTISFSGDEGRPLKPCKSVCRILVYAWGPDATKYIGRSMTIYRDATVKWGGMDVGGIRVSAMSDISSSITLALTATRGSKKITVVKPLVVEKAVTKDKPTPLEWFTAKIASLPDKAACFSLLDEGTKVKAMFNAQPERDREIITEMLSEKAGTFMAGPQGPDMDADEAGEPDDAEGPAA